MSRAPNGWPRPGRALAAGGCRRLITGTGIPVRRAPPRAGHAETSAQRWSSEGPDAPEAAAIGLRTIAPDHGPLTRRSRPPPFNFRAPFGFAESGHRTRPSRTSCPSLEAAGECLSRCGNQESGFPRDCGSHCRGCGACSVPCPMNARPHPPSRVAPSVLTHAPCRSREQAPGAAAPVRFPVDSPRFMVMRIARADVPPSCRPTTALIARARPPDVSRLLLASLPDAAALTGANHDRGGPARPGASGRRPAAPPARPTHSPHGHSTRLLKRPQTRELSQSSGARPPFPDQSDASPRRSAARTTGTRRCPEESRPRFRRGAFRHR